LFIYLFIYLSDYKDIKDMNDIIEANFVGVYRTYYKSGELESEVFVNAGKKEGIYKSYYEIRRIIMKK
jgi:antitoxin component YwqK of YwqJK toxin-antitoxin module